MARLAFGLPLADALGVARRSGGRRCGGSPERDRTWPRADPGCRRCRGRGAGRARSGWSARERPEKQDARSGPHPHHRPVSCLVGCSRKRTSDTAGRDRARVLATGGPPARLHAAVAELFHVGATSGHDLCAGMAGILAGSTLEGTICSNSEAATTTRSPL